MGATSWIEASIAQHFSMSALQPVSLSFSLVVGRRYKVGHRSCTPLDGLTHRAANLGYKKLKC